MTQIPNQQQMEAFFKGKPVSDKFLTELSTRVKALLEGLEAAAKSFEQAPAAASSQPNKPIDKE
jgi:hypothetical protein